jgi:hypothetical protein
MKYLNSRVLLLGALAIIPFYGAQVSAQVLEPPSDVRNVTATAKDKAVLLEWDEATDEDGIVVRYIVYYGVTPVTDEGGSYDQEIDTQSDALSYEVTNLVNDDTYYFGVTAVDEQGNESELYSVEVSATPTAGSGSSSGNDGSPILQNAVHTAPNKILVVMSEPVQLDEPTEAFELTEDATGNNIAVLNALVNSQQVTLIIDPSLLEVDEIYRVTATTGVTDFDGNPVSSGIVDSVEFRAQENFEAPPEEEAIEEEEEEEVLLDEEPLIVAEPEETAEPATPDDFGTFFLDDQNDSSETADFLDSLLSPENPINNLESEELEPLTVSPSTPDVPESTSDLSSAPDQIPPQDARNISADTSNFQSGEVLVQWTPAVDLDNDIKDQVLYTRVGLGAWDQGLSLGKDITQAKISVQPNQNYQIRLVTIDQSGNESFGAPFEFSTTLSQSGGGQGTVIALSVIAVLGFFFLFAGGRRT